MRQRVQKLLDQGVMQIVAVTDPPALGFLRQATVGITVEGSPRFVADTLAAMPEVKSVALTAGSFDLLAEVVCEDDEHLAEVISDRIRALPAVRATESFVFLKLKKQTRLRGTRQS